MVWDFPLTYAKPADANMEVEISKTHNPEENLQEEYRLYTMVESRVIPNALFFWINDECLVRGQIKSQKYGWYDEQLAQTLGVSVYQRITGGGVVYQDIGNLNWSILLKTTGKAFSPEKIFFYGSSYIIKALRNLDLKPNFVSPNRIEIDGKKVSGMAARSGIHCLLIHGTLLINTNLTRLNQLCKPPKDYPPVANLSEWKTDISAQKIIDSIIEVFEGEGFIIRIH